MVGYLYTVSIDFFDVTLNVNVKMGWDGMGWDGWMHDEQQ